jgi:DNA gyrase/topoisomerase IV subunit A
MIRKSDVQWWVLEVKKHPESAPEIIEELAQRLVEMDSENEQLRTEIIRMQQGTIGSASTEVQDLRRKVAELQTLMESEAATEPALVFVSSLMQLTRLPYPRAQELIRAGQPVLERKDLLELHRVLYVRPYDEILLLTSQGRGRKLRPADIPILAEGGSWPAREDIQGSTEERLSAAIATQKPPRFRTVVTRQGFVKQIISIALDRAMAQGDSILESPLHNDRLVDLVSSDRGDILLVTRWGKWTRFPQRAISGQGAEAMKLEPDDQVVAALPLISDIEVLVVTASGHVSRRDTAQLEARTSPGGAGKPLIQAYDVLGVYPFQRGAQLLYLTYSGRMRLVPVDGIPLLQKANKGTRVQDFGSDNVAAVTLIPHGD